MSSTREPPPIISGRGEVLENGEMTQAGRSRSALSSERNAAELRSQSALLISPRDQSSDLTVSRSGGSNSTQLERTPSAPSGNRRASYVPNVPSPLKSASSQSSVGSNGEERVKPDRDISPIASSSSGDASVSQISGDVRPFGRAQRKGSSNLSPAQSLLHQKSALQYGRPQKPKHISDLGQDYSRYPTLSSTWNNYSRTVTSNGTPLESSSASLLRTTTKNPPSDSQANLEKCRYPDDSIGAIDPYFGGEKGFILYPDEVEEDDKYHTPSDDDSLGYRPHWKDLTIRNIASTIGGIVLVLGLLCLFVLLPVLTFSTNLIISQSGAVNVARNDGPAWAHVNNRTYDLLKNIRTGLIDPDTPSSAMNRTSTFDGSSLELVFSDEFNVPNRTFYPGDDPFWTAPNIWYGATQDMEWYDPDAVTTADGTLQLRLDAFANHNLQYRSGMLNSWNQLCFKGGVFEISVSLAGPAGVPGLWPGAWTIGNLGRPGYLSTTEGVWPYTYDKCDLGITPNQSDPTGLSHLPGQKLSSCSCPGADHPNPGTGRGAPEIDILEASVDSNNRIGVVTQSYQVAPFDVYYRPNSDFMQMPNYNTTQMNAYCGGPFQQAVSATTLLNNSWYNGTAYQKYAFEYVPGTSTGKIAWFVGEDQTFMMDGRAIGQNGNVGARHVSEEPMSMVLNLGLSGAWSEILMADLIFPTIMHIDYVRLYQKPGATSITCDPPGFPTTEYIAAHPGPYNNPNLTVSFSNSILGISELMWNSIGTRQDTRGLRTHSQDVDGRTYLHFSIRNF